MYQAVVTKINVRPHPNADKLLLGSCAGFQVVVGKETKDGDLGVFFPADGQLSAEYAKANDLIAVRDEKGKHVSGGFFSADRRVRAQSFRGERSEGYWAPISSLLVLAPGSVQEGDRLNTWQGIPLCEKFLTEATLRARERSAAKAAKNPSNFPRHYDTENIRFMPAITEHAVVIVTEKIHGTSQRTGLVEFPKREGLLSRVWRRLRGAPVPSEFRYVTGSRNVTFDGPSAERYRNQAAALFEGKLLPGEIVYYEIAGYESPTTPIMASQATKKGFGDQYGVKMTYTYGCSVGEHKVFVYRITRHTDEGVREYPWTDVVRRCQAIGVSPVPVVRVWGVADDDADKGVCAHAVDQLLEGRSLLDDRHIREGVCVRVEGAASGTIGVYKAKSHTFGVLEGYLKDSGVVDAEEAA